MKTLALAAALFGLLATPVLAQQSTAPGQQMQDKGSVKGTTGASGYAPGHRMHKKHASLKKTHAKSTVGMSSTRGKTTTGVSKGDTDMKASTAKKTY